MNGPHTPAKVHRPKKNGRKRGRRKRASAPTLAILDGLLLRKMRVSLGGKEREITVLEAIVHQLMQKEAAGDARASRALLKYEQLARLPIEPPQQITFVDDTYTKRLAAKVPGRGDD